MVESKNEPWNVNRLLVLAGAACILIAIAIFSGGSPAKMFSQDTIPLFPGVLVALVLLFWQRPWLYLLAGVLVALFPLVILFVFGAFEAILHPSSGLEGGSLTVLLLAAILALTGGIAGFVQGRRAAQPPVSMAAPQAPFAIAVSGIVLGMVLVAGLAGSDVRALSTAPASNIVPDETMRVVLTGYAFAPRDIQLEQGKLYALELENGDASAHTFTYHAADGTERNTVIPAHSTVTIHMRFTQPQTIHFWCAPHSMGAGDTSEDSMVGTMVVA